MKKHALTALVFAAALSMYGCSGKPAETPAETTEITTEAATEVPTEATEEEVSEVSTATGIVIDATMNSLTIQLAGYGPFSFDTSMVEKKELRNGLIIGTPITISYTGEFNDAQVTKLADSEETPVLSQDRLQFAADIITAVNARDLERLASLASYPLYVGLDDGLTISSADELKALDPEEVFTDKLVQSVITTDLFTAEEVEAGVVLNDGSAFNIIFKAGETGILGIVGINYGE